MINLISEDLDINTIILFWQFILKGLNEINIVSNPILSLEMLVIRLLHLKEMPSFEDIISDSENKSVHELASNTNKIRVQDNKSEHVSKDQIKSTIQRKPEIKSLDPSEASLSSINTFEDLAELASKKKEIELKYDLERNVNLIKFSTGKIDIAFNENLSKNFVRNLSEKLFKWTGRRWVITLAKGQGQKTLNESQLIKKKELLEKEKESNLYKEFKNVFSDAELTEIKKKD